MSRTPGTSPSAFVDRRQSTRIGEAQASGQPVEPVAAELSPLLASADLQDHLLTACTDLERLQVLLADACHVLMASFHSASEQLSQHRRRGAARELAGVLVHVQQQLDNAVTALQFQDMSSQLIVHTHQRLRSCADQLASGMFADDGEGEAVVEPLPLRPNPVTQSEMDAGSIELF